MPRKGKIKIEDFFRAAGSPGTIGTTVSHVRVHRILMAYRNEMSVVGEDEPCTPFEALAQQAGGKLSASAEWNTLVTHMMDAYLEEIIRVTYELALRKRKSTKSDRVHCLKADIIEGVAIVDSTRHSTY